MKKYLCLLQYAEGTCGLFPPLPQRPELFLAGEASSWRQGKLDRQSPIPHRPSLIGWERRQSSTTTQQGQSFPCTLFLPVAHRSTSPRNPNSHPLHISSSFIELVQPFKPKTPFPPTSLGSNSFEVSHSFRDLIHYLLSHFMPPLRAPFSAHSITVYTLFNTFLFGLLGALINFIQHRFDIVLTHNAIPPLLPKPDSIGEILLHSLSFSIPRKDPSPHS